MAFRRYGLGGQIIPFWKREIESLPKWQKGDPQIRLLMPTFWMKMIKPPEHTPNNQVHFVTHPQMTRMDIKNYLEKIYNVPVTHVSTEVKLSINRNPHQSEMEAVSDPGVYFDPVRDKMRQNVKWSEEYKLARVLLGEGQTFDYPDLESKITTLDSEEKAKSDLEESKNKRQTAQTKSSHVPGWFS